jgi:hypothetical protein
MAEYPPERPVATTTILIFGSAATMCSGAKPVENALYKASIINKTMSSSRSPVCAANASVPAPKSVFAAR